ncbi:transmembrane protein 234-like [Elysia marginata]|uniref:Transmembrane protein 234-like n=1 Tax=Elysia marginata TaxID=1093978 RepID=A0AAV4GSJ4_9GAST|nr:transmembrane protein 234-like [Elysia marginata]
MDDQLSGYRDAVNLVVVAALWGMTNPLLKKNSKGIEDINRDGKFSQMMAEFFFLVSNWKYIVSFVMNQTGSVVYYLTLASADLTLAVPITNSMTFMFTALSSHLLGEKHLNFNTLLGIALVAVGVLLCVLGKTDTS